MTRDELASDLAYVRAMAEEGRHAPLLGGSYLLFWGILNALAYGAHWAVLQGMIPNEGGAAFVMLWCGYGVIAGLGSVVLGGRAKEKPGKSALGVRTERAIWAGVGLAIGIVAAGAIGRMVLEGDPTAPNTIMSPVLALLGVALATISMMARERWLFAFALVSYAAAVVIGVYANASWAYPVAAIANLIVLAIPGVVLLRREPSAIV
jgi:hypothetical protein